MQNKSSLSFPTNKDLVEQITFDLKTGKVWFNEQRMLLTHSSFFWKLRQELISTLGKKRTKALLMRLGYDAGLKDAEIAKKIRPDLSSVNAFMAGPQLALIRGMVNVKPITFDFDINSGHFAGEFNWKEAFEADLYITNKGQAHEPICWILTAYSSGFASFYMGKSILFKEVQCKAMGEETCTIIGKPAEEWEDSEELLSVFLPDNIVDELSIIRKQLANLKQSDKLYQNTESSSNKSIGKSDVFLHTCHLIKQSSQGNVTVLLQGETGVGKELFARSLHSQSARANKPFVAVNCACIPPELIESELFGTEKGAFTGAVLSRKGKFERALQGTLFLDEVAELSPRAQAALLRALQEGEIERVGGGEVIKVDVRLVAATHVDLEKAIQEGRFRQDLFYRLSVYPVKIPSLRERTEDIPLLVTHFLKKHNGIYKKNIIGVSDKAMNVLMERKWPGNIRELENYIERGVILTENNSNLSLDFLAQDTESPTAQTISKINTGGALETIEEKATEYVDQASLALLQTDFKFDDFEVKLYKTALSKANGNVTEAAKNLGLRRAQLAYRIEKLNITF